MDKSIAGGGLALGILAGVIFHNIALGMIFGLISGQVPVRQNQGWTAATPESRVRPASNVRCPPGQDIRAPEALIAASPNAPR